MSTVRKRPRRWTPEEDSLLHQEATAMKQSSGSWDWNRIAANFADRSNKDCRKRWVNRVSGGLKKGPWVEKEDGELRQAVERLGQRWTLVAEEVAGRSADQCAKRWTNHLDPQLNRKEWTKAEDDNVLLGATRFGRQWKEIRDFYFPGRSRNDVKNRYTILVRRGVRASASTSKDPHVSAAESDIDSDDEEDASGAELDDQPITDTMMDMDFGTHPDPFGAFGTFDFTATGMLSPSAALDPFAYTLSDVGLHMDDGLLQPHPPGPNFPPTPMMDGNLEKGPYNADHAMTSEDHLPSTTGPSFPAGIVGTTTTNPFEIAFDVPVEYDASCLHDDVVAYGSNKPSSILIGPSSLLPRQPSYRRVTLVLEDYEKGLMDQLLQIVSSSQGKSQIEIQP